MKNIKYLTSLLLIILGCNSDESIKNPTIEEPSIEYNINSISPLRSRIGDTIKISGTNLTKLHSLYFLHEDRIYYQDTIKMKSISFITQNENEITLKIPEVYHENMVVEFPNTNNFKLEIVGIIPIINNFEHVRQIQVIDKDIVLLKDNNKIYKSTDGFYKWETVYESPNDHSISSFYYLDENNCWIGLQGNTGISIHYSNNGGNDTNLKFQVSSSNSGNQINKIQFSSLSKGFFVDNNQEMYIADNGIFENIYSYYPNLSMLPFGKIEIWDFNAINEDLIFLAPNDKPFLIKIDNQKFTYSEFDLWPLSPIFFDNIGYVQVNSDIHKTNDLGNSWNKIKTFENHYPRIQFLNNQEGFAFVNYSPAEMYITKNGGTTWEKYFTFPQYHDGHHKDFTEINGLIGSANGRLWKYRKE